jgi:hypothetical protein
MVDLTWTQKISEPGTYWYVDVDYTTPIQIEVDERKVIHLDGDAYSIEDLIREEGHFYGPINIDVPEVTEDILKRFEAKREEIMELVAE